MMDRGRVALDLEGERRRGADPEELVRAFQKVKLPDALVGRAQEKYDKITPKQ
ncbi:MAG TPA: hypothetical protein VGL23_16895 [Chloroflexota bacterium]